METIRICKHCGKKHEGEGLPPSLKSTLKVCVNCYREKKKESDKDWNDHHRSKRSLYMSRWRKEHPKETAESWRERTRKWKHKKKLRKLK